jgi:hypothetical protein
MKLTLHSPDYKTAWKLNLSQRQFSRVDNGRAVSCGLMLGETVSLALLKRWTKAGQAVPVDAEKAKHSGCQSRCILRGDSICQW